MYQRYNLGCGANVLEGFININAGWNVLLSKIPWIKKPLFKLKLIHEMMLPNLDKRIKFGRIPQALRKIKTGSADRVYSCHLVEHLTQKESLRMLEECFRILVSNGLMRIGAPDGVRLVQRYLRDTEACLRKEEDTCRFRDQMFGELAGGYVSGDKNAHRFLWDIPSMRYTLKKIGFKEITVCSYKNGKDPEMAQIDNHEEISFFIEAVKP
jgi:hypothetical protein